MIVHSVGTRHGVDSASLRLSTSFELCVYPSLYLDRRWAIGVVALQCAHLQAGPTLVRVFVSHTLSLGGYLRVASV